MKHAALKRCEYLFSVLMLIFLSAPLSFAGIVEMPIIEESTALYGTSIYENYNIPSVNNRNSHAVNSTRLWVKKISLQGIKDFPELGIRAIEVQAYIEKLRYDLMRENEIEEYGHSQKEIAEMADLLNKMDAEHRYEHASTLDLQRFIWLVRSQKEQRGLSISEVEGIALKVQEYYRHRGLQLATAFVSRQPMRDGLVTITISSGVLGAVEVQGNRLYQSDMMTRVFDDILTEPFMFNRINERSYLINDYPGLRVNGKVLEGYQVNDARLVLEVASEQAFNSTLRLDNHGSELTGEFRGFAEIFWNNPTGIADQLNLAVLQSTSPDNSTYGLIGYRLPIFSPRWHLSLSASTNQFILDQTQDATGAVSQLGIIGNTEQTHMDIRYTFRRSREKSIWFSLILDSTRTLLNSQTLNNNNLGLDDKIRNIRAAMQFDILNSQSRRLHLGEITATQGEFLQGAGAREPDYRILNANYTLMNFVPLPWFNTTTRMLFKSELQYSDNALPAAEQDAIASPTKVRAYPINQFSTDRSVYLGIEWIFNTPEFLMFDGLRVRNIPQKMQPLFFINAAKGIQNSVTASDVKGTLADFGFGLQYGLGKNISGNLQIAFPVKDKFNADITVPSDNFKIVFDFQYRI